MSHSLIRHIFILLLAVFVIAGMGLSAVQASSMSFKMMGMAPGMGTSAGGGCDDCGSPGDSKGMAACLTSGCVAPVAAHSPSVEVLNIAPAAVHRLHQDLALSSRDSGPDPYPPRTTDIG